MVEKLNELYLQCLNELNSIGINMQNKELIGDIDIKINKRASKKYGCCKQEKPDKRYKIIQKKAHYRIIKYEKFQSHHIEISNWVMQLKDDIIKNTIIHELIHCIPFCNNHGKEFKKYAKYINEKLGYKITTKGNIQEDYRSSQLEYTEEENYKYKIICQGCGQIIYRKRFKPNLIQKYCCGKCKEKLKIIEIR